MNIKLIEPVSITDYAPIVKDVSFGNLEDNEQALGSYGRYVGLLEPRRNPAFIGENGQPDVWEQRVAYFADKYPLEPLGVTGWYLWPPFNLDRIWLGWFGIRKQYQRQGYGKLVFDATIKEINKEFPTIKWLFVFTDNADKFYQKCGGERLGTIQELIDAKYPGIDKDTGFNLNEVVLRIPIALSR